MRCALLFVLLVAACTDQLPTPPDASDAQAPLRYIVSLERGVRPGLIVTGEGITARFLWDALSMFSADMMPERAEGLRRNPQVRSVELDGPVRMTCPLVPCWIPLAAPYGSAAVNSWGLDRIDARYGLDGQYTVPATGAGVPVYIMDTGIRCTHVELAGRCSYGFDAFGGDAHDYQGHGTHVAGIAAGRTYGAASGAHVVSVRVLNENGNGTWEGLLAGIDWIMTQPKGPANMSLTGPVVHQGIFDAITRATDAGYLMAAAAGNSSADACGWTPAGAPDALTVGATTQQYDFLSWFSSFGSCVDIFAPGDGIVSACVTSDTGTCVKSGTSMATPFAAGVAALAYQMQGPDARAAMALIKSTASRSIVKESRSPHGDLLYARLDGVHVLPPNSPPVAAWTYSCVDLACQFTSQMSDPDGNLDAFAWSFGDGTGHTGQDPTKTYAAAGTYTVTLDVWDTQAAKDSEAKTITVGDASPPPPPPPPPSTITLTATVVNTGRGFKNVRLDWTGAQGASVFVSRNGSLIATPPNTGTYTDVLNQKGALRYAYKVCDASTCSPEVRP